MTGQSHARRDKLIFRALVALDAVVQETHHGPVKASLAVRFCLAYLYTQATGDRSCYVGFLESLSEPWRGNPQADYLRFSYATSQWRGIVRSVGVRDDIEFNQRIFAARKRGDVQSLQG